MGLGSVAAAMPWAYDWDRFPAAWFGANATTWESSAQIAEIGKYSMAILGWQHLADIDDWSAVVYTQLSQAAIIKEAHPSLPVFVYAGFGWAFGLNAGVEPLMLEPDGGAYSDFFLQSTDGPEYTRTNCQQMHSSNPRCVGWFWKFSNASARDWFVEKLVRPLALAPMIDGVFFDAFNYAYDIPEVRPWGRPVVNVPNCTSEGGEGCEALLAGTLDVARRTAELLNQHGKVPMFANPGYFENRNERNIWLNESRLVDALLGLDYFTYYENARAEQLTTILDGWWIDNMLREGKASLPAGVHPYYREVNGTLEDVTPHVAAFMLVREAYWYYFGSTGWFDNNFKWSELYEMKCGEPLDSMEQQGQSIFSRRYLNCNVTLDCSQASEGKGDCTATIAQALL